MPPTPIAAMLSFPDGDCPAKTCRGAIAADTAASAAVEANSLRVMARFDRSLIGLCSTQASGGLTAPWRSSDCCHGDESNA